QWSRRGGARDADSQPSKAGTGGDDWFLRQYPGTEDCSQSAADHQGVHATHTRGHTRSVRPSGRSIRAGGGADSAGKEPEPQSDLSGDVRYAERSEKTAAVPTGECRGQRRSERVFHV